MARRAIMGRRRRRIILYSASNRNSDRVAFAVGVGSIAELFGDNERKDTSKRTYRAADTEQLA
jgi:hypothetical protein